MSVIIVMHNPAEDLWHRYSAPHRVIAAYDVEDVVGVLAEVERCCVEQSLYAVGFVGYEAAPAFDPKLQVRAPGALPLAWFALFSQRENLSHLPDRESGFTGSWQLDETAQEYALHIAQLRAHIGAGDVYQVNYTTRFQAQGQLDEAWFNRVATGAPYATYIETDEFCIASASPELFFTRQQEELQSKPMKGTAARGLSSVADLQQASWLADSDKNRAENLMITDMVRNDMGRIASPGSVVVPSLFAVEQYPTVWQMTSTVQAISAVNLVQIFTALFPAASITGAPKRASMTYIAELERSPRQVYTGAIGVVEPTGDAAFSVAIRTAWSDKARGSSYYAAGGGIVWDSQAAEEFAEVKIKAALLDAPSRRVELMETMRWTPGEGVYLLEAHLARLADSARYFCIPCDLSAISQQLDGLSEVIDAAGCPHRLRLLVRTNGTFELKVSSLPEGVAPQRLELAAHAVDQADVRLYHKTTDRSLYTRASASVSSDAEALLFNKNGCVTESVIANVVYRWQGELYTPPVEDGLLPGTLRGHLIAQGKVRERSLELREMREVEDWYLVNALRGWRRALIPQT